MSEKLCVQWNDFKDNIFTAFGSLRDDKDFSDVTLACDNGKQLSAHRLILAASSPFFQDILRKNKHAHPIIYMRGVKSDDLKDVVDFLYFGEANLYQENLDSFLGLADELQLKGLMGRSHPDQEVNAIEGHKDTKGELSNVLVEKESNVKRKNPRSVKNEKTIALPSLISLEELEEKVLALMEKNPNHFDAFDDGKQPAYNCKVCGKEARRNDMKRHIVSNHLEGVAIPCNICDRTFKTRDSLKNHVKQHSRLWN